MIILHTNKGDIKIELDFDKAPVTAKNFEQYVKDGFLRRRNLPPRHQRLHDSRRRHG
ncbi:peptidyl-prolyl cis-trans isomerase B [Neisseria meningitidis]|nr:peptidyl-prolyl cis-trans isomerase B [Neisseria meningitidis]